MRLAITACLAFLLCALPALSQSEESPADSIRASRFDRLDRTAQSILWTLGCAQTASRARALPDSTGYEDDYPIRSLTRLLRECQRDTPVHRCDIHATSIFEHRCA
jgi:hypothetical protein